MSPRAKELLEEVMKWDAKTRQDFVTELLEAEPSEEEWTEELVRRAEEALSGKEDLLEAEDVYTAARAALAHSRRAR